MLGIFSRPPVVSGGGTSLNKTVGRTQASKMQNNNNINNINNKTWNAAQG